jgi:hypothetical protein
MMTPARNRTPERATRPHARERTLASSAGTVSVASDDASPVLASMIGIETSRLTFVPLN